MSDLILDYFKYKLLLNYDLHLMAKCIVMIYPTCALVALNTEVKTKHPLIYSEKSRMSKSIYRNCCFIYRNFIYLSKLLLQWHQNGRLSHPTVTNFGLV